MSKPCHRPIVGVNVVPRKKYLSKNWSILGSAEMYRVPKWLLCRAFAGVACVNNHSGLEPLSVVCPRDYPANGNIRPIEDLSEQLLLLTLQL